MAKATRRTATPVGARRVAGREVLRRARQLHADAVEVIGAYYDLAARYEGLAAAVDVFWDDTAAVDDALLDVHESLGLHAVLLALEAATLRFEEVGLDTFAAGARATFGMSSPTLGTLRDAGEAIGTEARPIERDDLEQYS
jgi:hypothetical protein